MFTRIARRYDLMNSLMTGGRHHAWRVRTARAAIEAPPGPILDLATGTADLALAVRAMAPDRAVIGVDFSEGMLDGARRKLERERRRPIPLAAGDALRLPFADKTFAAVASAFLLRNLEDLRRGFEEMRRVTMAGGRVVALDIVRPTVPVWSAIFGLYFRLVIPSLGALVAGDRAAYTYLPASVDRFLTPAELARLMTEVGLRDVTWRTVGLGTVALHVGLA